MCRITQVGAPLISTHGAKNGFEAPPCLAGTFVRGRSRHGEIAFRWSVTAFLWERGFRSPNWFRGPSASFPPTMVCKRQFKTCKKTNRQEPPCPHPTPIVGANGKTHGAPTVPPLIFSCFSKNKTGIPFLIIKGSDSGFKCAL